MSLNKVKLIGNVGQDPEIKTIKDKINPSYYKDMKISPIEYITENNIDYVIGNVIKYVSRYQNKNGIEDLKKAKWYIDYKIKELENE